MSRVSVQEQRGLIINGQEAEPWISGTFHYWRSKPEFWSDILSNIKAMGFNMVETYIPWGVHEIERGRFDFGGTDPAKNLEGFIQKVHQANLKLIVRPGPHINAELTLFGYPERVIYDPEVAAKEASGAYSIHDAYPKAFPNPSYASGKLYGETALWFDALAPILKRNLYPEGPIVALQVDNETGYYFRTGAYLLDYGKDSILWYRTFLEMRYGAIANLNKIYGSNYKGFMEIEPPRSFQGKTQKDLPYYLDWSRYKEWQISQCLKQVGEMWKERGIEGIPFFHNFFGPLNSPYNTNQAEWGGFGLDVVGIDNYPRKEQYLATTRIANYLAGTSKLPFIPEFGSGCWSLPLWENTFTVEDERFTTPLLFMFGLKAVNYYMLVERDRWMGSPITQDNKIRTPYFEMYRHWNAFLRRSHFHEWDLQADLLLLANYDQDRLLKALKKVENHFVHFLPEEVGYEENQSLFHYRVEEEGPRWTDGSWRFALRNHLPLHCSDTVTPMERLRGHKAVWVPTFEALEKEAQDNLRNFAEEGGTVLMGPQVPSLDGDYRPYCAFPELRSADEAKVGKGRLVLMKEFNEEKILQALAQAGVKPVLEGLPPQVLATQFHRDGKSMIFLANPQDAPITFTVGQKLSPLYGTPEDKSLKPGHLTLDPWSVTVWEVRP